MRKLTLEYVEQCFEEGGCKLLEKEYVNNSTKMKYECNCGDINEITFSSFQLGRRCKKCGIKKGSENQKHTIEFVKQCFLEGGCILLEDEYVNCMTKMRYECVCGDINRISFSSFQNGHRCKKCGKRKNAERFSFTLEYVKGFFEENGCEMLDDFYVNARAHINYRCICGNVSKIIFDSFRRGHRCNK